MKFESILRKFLIAGIFLIPFIPLIVTVVFFFPFITGKNFAFRILTELLFGGWILLALYSPAFRPRFSWILAAIASFVGIIAIADIFGENPLKSIWSNFERMEGLITLIHLFAYFLIAGTVLNTEKLWNYFLNTSIGVSIFIGLYGLFQLAGFITINQSAVRLDATFGNATYLAIYMLFHVFITAIMLVRWRGVQTMQWIYGAIILLQTVIVYHTATRGAILGLLGGVLLSALLIVFFGKEYRKLRKISIGVIIGVLVIIMGFFLIRDSQFVKNSQVLSRFSDISISEDKVNARFVNWNMALKGVKERPFLGWGQENFNFVFNKYYDPKMYAQEQWFDRVHNVVLDWLIAGGIFGFLAYASMFLATLYYTWKKTTKFSVVEKSLITGLLAGYTFHNLFVFDNIMSYILFFTIMAYVYWMSNNSTQVKETVKTQSTVYSHRDINKGVINRGMINSVYAPLIIIATLFSVYLINVNGIRTAGAILQALSPQPGGQIKNLEFFQKAISYNSFGTQEAREQLSQNATRVASSDVDIETKQKYLTTIQLEFEKQLKEMPNDARAHIFAGTTFDAFGQYDAARMYLERASELSPNKQTIMFQLGLNKLNRGDTNGALQVFKKAFDLAPEYQNARIFYAIGAIYVKDDSLLEELLIPKFGSVIVDNDRLLQAYFNTKQISKVLDIWKLRVEKDPTNTRNYLGLAATYLELNMRQETIMTIEKIIELDPTFKDQGEFFISEIRAGRNP